MNSPVTHPSALEVLRNAPPIEAASHPITQRFGLPPHPVHIDFGTVTIGDIEYEQPLILRIVNERLELVQCAFMQDRKPVLTYPELNVKGFAFFGDLKHDKPVIVTYNLEAFFKIAQTGYPVVLAILPNLCNANPSELNLADFKRIQLVINQLSSAGFMQIYIPVRPEHIGEPEFQKLAQNTSVKLLNQYVEDTEGSDLIELSQYDDVMDVQAFLDHSITSLPEHHKNAFDIALTPLTVAYAMAEFGIELITNQRLEPYSNLANAIAILRCHPKFSGHIWYDTFHQEMFTTWDCDHPRKWVDADRLRIAEIFQRQFGLVKFSDDLIEKAAIAVAQECQRDELKDWLLSLKWDGQNRLNGWLEKTVGIPRDEYHDSVGNNFIRSLVARGLTPGCKVDTMPVFEGKQGLRKSTMLEILGGKFYSELNESLETKDFFVVIQGAWLIEVGEMQSMRKADVTRIKQILSSRQDRCRLPYAKRAVDLPRRVVFAGSTNETEYLRDPTGARRFWPVACKTIDIEWLKNNREQLFAEAVHQVNNGATWWEVNEDEARKQTDARQEESDLWQSMLAEKLRFKNRVTVLDAFEILDVPINNSRGSDGKRLASALRAIGFERKRLRQKGTNELIWMYIRSTPVAESDDPGF